MFGWFKKKVVEEVPKEQPKELTLEERINMYRKNYFDLFDMYDKMIQDQIRFNVGDVVKLDVVGSPEMTVVAFRPFSYTFSDLRFGFSWRIISNFDLWIGHTVVDAYVKLNYFDANFILQELITTPDKVIK